jgi:hypothetical protein
VRTATGPGGISGPLRVDLEGRYSYDVMGVRSSAPWWFCLVPGITHESRLCQARIQNGAIATVSSLMKAAARDAHCCLVLYPPGHVLSFSF